ncbi:6-bladed beta-propeller [Lunatibacter salilacus]|uniref:6-bladed beta-propeller n=1 Tax=Lunatibacter salilacus TaxID=2483804 RepID=UPI00131BF649|nr:6-bladed beta-propeller [Lunatibacter salilacus]
MDKPILFLAILLFCFSCDQNSKIVDRILRLEDFTEVNTPYKVTKIIPLETRPEILLGEYLSVKISEDHIYIYDKNTRNAIQRFDREGNYLGPAALVGEGPNTLNAITDFLISDARLVVLESMGAYSRIQVFNENGQIIKTIETTYLGFSFSKLDNGNYVLYGGFNLPLTENRIVKLTSSGEITDTYLPNTYTGSMLPMQEQNFVKSGNNLYFHEVFAPKVFSISDSLETVLGFDFGRYAIPERYFEMDWMEGFEMINSQGFAAISDYFRSGEFHYIGVDVQVEGQLARHHLLWDGEKGTKRIFSPTQLPAFQYPVAVIGDELLFISQAAHLLELEPNDLPEGAQHLDPEDNPVLVFVDLSDN